MAGRGTGLIQSYKKVIKKQGFRLCSVFVYPIIWTKIILGVRLKRTVIM